MMIALDGHATDLHSRSRLAGYDPQTLQSARILVVGAGALGQNLLVNLALAGIGRLDIVDHDVFEDHNRTRSPCYPTPSEQAWTGLGKAKAVAHKILSMMTAVEPVVCYAAARIQDVGDEAIEQADVVCSAVDNAAARHYLADRCSLHGKLMVEGGFEGSRLNLSVFVPHPEQPCYRCIVPSRTGVFSCDRYAMAAEAARIVPAIQTGAGALGALQAEQVIEALHGRASLVGKRMFGDIRTLSFRVHTLSVDADCQGAHRAPARHVDVDLGPSATVAQLVELVRSRFGNGQLRFPEQFVGRIPCSICKTLTEAMSPESRWELDPRCQPCGGPFPRSHTGASPYAYPYLRMHHPEEWEPIAGMPLKALGLSHRSAIEMETMTTDTVTALRLAAPSVSSLTEVRPAHDNEKEHY